MRLSTLITAIEGRTHAGDDPDIAGLSEDSRKVDKGWLFIATPGTRQDGRAFIDDAVRRGVVAVVVPTGSDMALPAGVARIEVSDIRRATSAMAMAFHPGQPDTMVAVTGTSGKTSVAHFTRELWQAQNHNAASIGTLGLVTATNARYGNLTTPDAIALHRQLDECTSGGITHMAIEASSHGIELHRLDHVRLKAAGFTNLSRDHLDHHGTMEAYLAAKTRLFAELLPRRATAVLNADIAEFEGLRAVSAAQGHEIVDYGRQGKAVQLIERRQDARGQRLRITLFGRAHDLLLPVAGEFQVWNALCALGLVIGSGGAVDGTLAAMEKLTPVAGRLQSVGMTADGGMVYVDYAHKPDALRSVLQAVRAGLAPGARLGIVFGCGGDRDRGKRPVMGGIAATAADWAIVTDDNPRGEEPAAIRAEILAGCAGPGEVIETGDRAAAIRQGIGRLGRGDALVIAGKGHESGQIVGDVTLPFDDADMARKVLES